MLAITVDKTCGRMVFHSGLLVIVYILDKGFGSLAIPELRQGYDGIKRLNGIGAIIGITVAVMQTVPVDERQVLDDQCPPGVIDNFFRDIQVNSFSKNPLPVSDDVAFDLFISIGS